MKGYAAHEKGVFEEITKARAHLQTAASGNSVPEKAAADAEMAGALVNLNAVAEAYPDLKANANFQDLQKQLAETENQISFARQYYNDAVADLNKQVVTIPWMFFTGSRRSRGEFYTPPRARSTRRRGVRGQTVVEVRAQRASKPRRPQKTLNGRN